jgi:hypothetical protein
MAEGSPAPLAEAIERMGEAAQAYLDGPVAFLRAAVDRSVEPNYDADTAAADAAGYFLWLARAWWGGVNAVIDATAILAVPPGDCQRFEVPVPSVAVPSTIRILSRTWTWKPDPVEPANVQILLEPPTTLAPGTTSVCLRVTPLVLEPSWTVDLEIVPAGSTTGTTFTVRLDASSELAPTSP